MSIVEDIVQLYNTCDMIMFDDILAFQNDGVLKQCIKYRFLYNPLSNQNQGLVLEPCKYANKSSTLESRFKRSYSLSITFILQKVPDDNCTAKNLY